MDEKMKKQLEKLINTSKINAKAVEVIMAMKQKDHNDLEIIATGILISKLIKKGMD